MSELKRKLTIEGIIKSVLVAMICSFAFIFIFSFVCWMLSASWYWIGFIAGGILAIILSMILYKNRFKPSENYIARRFDELGLAERSITMVDYQNDSSYIASLQRNDAVNNINSIDKKSLKINISIKMICILIISTLIASSMSLFAGLSSKGIVNGGNGIIDTVKDRYATRYFVEYLIEGAGEIDGEIVQSVEAGKNGTMVTAIADDGFVFYKWSDGNEDPVRSELEVNSDIEVTAIFVELEYDENSENDSDGDGQEDGELPSDPKDGNSDKSGSNNGEGQGTAGGGNTKTNTFGDGEKNYNDYWDQSKQDADDNMKNGDPGDKQIVEDYYNNIK